MAGGGVSIIVAFGVIFFLIYWFWVLAEPYNVYQNLAIFIISFLIAGGILAAMWAPWGMTHGSELHPPEDEKKEE
jgi:tetrahydromethanopterin S-methyltransferase subunit E